MTFQSRTMNIIYTHRESSPLDRSHPRARVERPPLHPEERCINKNDNNCVHYKMVTSKVFVSYSMVPEPLRENNTQAKQTSLFQPSH